MFSLQRSSSCATMLAHGTASQQIMANRSALAKIGKAPKKAKSGPTGKVPTGNEGNISGTMYQGRKRGK